VDTCGQPDRYDARRRPQIELAASRLLVEAALQTIGSGSLQTTIPAHGRLRPCMRKFDQGLFLLLQDSLFDSRARP